MKIEFINLFFPLKKITLIIMRTLILLSCITIFSFTPNDVLSQNAKIEIVGISLTITSVQVSLLIHPATSTLTQ